MAATCMPGQGASSSTPATAIAIARRVASGHSALLIVHTACATTATANTLRPISQPEFAVTPNCSRPRANAVISKAEGSVNPSQAISAPRRPARWNPRAMPTWLLAGPGRNWHKETSSPYAPSSIHRRRTTNSR